jgi:hypothetical protein
VQIQVSTTSRVDNRDDLVERIEGDIDSALARFGDQLIRVDVHLGDENGDKSPSAADKRCTVEARVAGSQQVAVTHHANSYDEAFQGATQKLKKLLDHRLGRMREKTGVSIRHLAVDDGDGE